VASWARGKGRRRALRILCTGIAALDEVFRVCEFPQADGKTMATEFVSVGGGCAANAAVTIARLGGRASFAGPLGGPAGKEAIGDRLLAGLAREKVDCSSCVRVRGVSSSISAIFVNACGERSIVNHCNDRLEAALPTNVDRLVESVDVVLADNRFPEFVWPICKAAHQRDIPVVLDVDKPTRTSDRLFQVASHIIFSSEGLRVTVGTDDLAAALAVVGRHTRSFLAVTDGPNDVIWRDGDALRRMSTFKVDSVDTLAAGDVFHGGFALALAEGQGVLQAMRFAAAAAAVKCTRFGGSAVTPLRSEVNAFLRQHAQ
jgi:sugar/nucleoside kinase (ribokinase family)